MQKTVNKLYHFLEPAAPYMGIIFILLGTFLTFWGNDFVNFVIFLVVTVALMCIGTQASFSLLGASKLWLNWVQIIVVSLIASAIGGWVSKNRKIGVTLISLFAGAAVGMTVAMSADLYSDGAFWGTTVGTGVLFAIASYFLETALIIIATSFVGAYMLVRGVSFYIPQGKWSFPNEFHLTKTNLHTTFYCYLGGIVVLACLGAFHQKRKVGDITYDRNGKRVY